MNTSEVLQSFEFLMRNFSHLTQPRHLARNQEHIMFILRILDGAFKLTFFFFFVLFVAEVFF